MDPETLKVVAKLVHDHAWLSLALVLLPILDNLIAEGKWPYGVSIDRRYRLILLGLGSSTVAAISTVQDGGNWRIAIACGFVVFAGLLLKNGETLFGPKTGKPDAVEHVPGGELPQPAGAELSKPSDDSKPHA